MSVNNPGPFDIEHGPHLVELTVTDSHGATDTCESTVTVVDSEDPVVDCGDRGIIAPCNVPVILTFGAMTKENGCPVEVDILHEKCAFCNPAGKEISRDCVIDGTTIIDSGGVQDHISWLVTATNKYGGVSAQETCTVCVQNPSADDSDPGCSGNDNGKLDSEGNQYECEASCPRCELKCGGDECDKL